MGNFGSERNDFRVRSLRAEQMVGAWTGHSWCYSILHRPQTTRTKLFSTLGEGAGLSFTDQLVVHIFPVYNNHELLLLEQRLMQLKILR